MNLKFQLHNHGFEVHPQACPPALLKQWQIEFPPDSEFDADLMAHSQSVREESRTGMLQKVAASILGADCFPTRAVLENRFDQPQPWRQETTVPPVETSMYGEMVCVRLSLDDCGFFDGALKLCPTSHKHGVLTEREVRGHSIRPFSSPELHAGDILVMHPLTIHASAASTTGKPRRVIHVTFAAAKLRPLLA